MYVNTINPNSNNIIIHEMSSTSNSNFSNIRQKNSDTYTRLHADFIDMDKIISIPFVLENYRK